MENRGIRIGISRSPPDSEDLAKPIPVDVGTGDKADEVAVVRKTNALDHTSSALVRL